MRNAKRLHLGQEAVCADGLGRITEIHAKEGNIVGSVKIDTYVNNRGCIWNIDNVNVVQLPVFTRCEYDFYFCK